MRSLFAFAMLAPLVFTVGCGAGSSVPTIQDTETAVRKDITENNKPITLVSLHKKDGQKSVENGVEYYRLEYEGEFELTKDCDGQDANAVCLRCDGTDNGTGEGYTHHVAVGKKGHRVKMLGVAKFEKTENGWRPPL